jgi:hypothetical protein
MPEIAHAEAVEKNRYRNAAATTFYRRAKLYSFLGKGIAGLLALAAPVAILAAPSAGPVLGAIAAGWLFLSRIGLDRFRREWQRQGALAAEAYDCGVLGIDWNPALGTALEPEEIRAGAAAKEARQKRGPRWPWEKSWWPWKQEDTKARSWYPSEGQEQWPLSVLLCQRSNAVWAARQHKSYAYLVGIAAVLWGAFGVIAALVKGAELSEYLITVLLPSLPAFLDAIENVDAHSDAANRRTALSMTIRDLIDGGEAEEPQLRDIQDELFRLRCEYTHVPEAFYHRIKADYERDMRYGAAQIGAEAQHRDGGRSNP